MDADKLMEKKWLALAFMLVASTVLRVFDLLTESGMLSIWMGMGGAFMAIEATERVMLARKTNEKTGQE